MPILKKYLLLGVLYMLPMGVYAQEEDAHDAEEIIEEVIDSVEYTQQEPYFPVQRSVDTDSAWVQDPVRTFQKEKLEKYLSDEDYRYDRKYSTDTDSLWRRFLQWLASKLGNVFVPEGSGSFWRTVGWILAGGLIVFAILKIVGADIRSFFSRKPKSIDLNYTEEETDIHTIDFDMLIAEAIAKQHYKRAVRLFYLKSLKQLSDKEWIVWQPHKTNFEYVRELNNHEVATDFRQVTFLFEYIWYGDFQLTPATFSDTEKKFKELEKRINRL